MESVIVKKDDLLDTLVENKTQHVEEYELAFRGYLDTTEEKLQSLIEKVQSGEGLEPYIHFPTPENHIAEYDTAISMLEWHNEETIEISRKDFARFVLDDWDWKDSWKLSNTAYIEKACANR